MPSPAYDPTPPRTRRWPWLVVVLLVVALVGGTVAGSELRDDAAGPPPAEHPPEWDSRVADLADYVEEARGLTFEHPVYVDFLSSEEYSEETRTEEDELTSEDREDLDESISWLRALGLAEGDIDLFDAFNDLSDTGTLAFYDPESERVTVRGTELTVDLEVTLVHELTHALQDQHFELAMGPDDDEGQEGEGDDEDVTYDTGPDEGYRALVEGDAVRIENTYIDEELTSEEADEYYDANAGDVEDAETGLADVPTAMQAFQAEPYLLGNPFVELLFEDGGNEAVDDAFGDPPSTTEHLYDPRSYLEGDDPTDVEYPDLPDGVDEDDDLLSRSDLGATSVYLVLADRIDPHVALDAADGWGNARYSHYEIDDRTCLRVAVDGDTGDDDQQLRSAFDLWVAAAPAETNASITDLGDGRSLVETCDPGPDAEATNDRALDNIVLPVTRAQITLQEVAFANEDVDDAWSIADCFVRELTMEQLTATDYLDPEIQAAVDAAFETCG